MLESGIKVNTIPADVRTVKPTQIKYPANWITETKNLEDGGGIVRIFPNEFMSERIPSVGFVIGFGQGTAFTNNITEYAKATKTAVETNPNARVINITTGPNRFCLHMFINVLSSYSTQQQK